MTEDRLIEKISEAELPICEYAFVNPETIPFREQVRYICRTECPRYGTTWACPPAVGTVEECRQKTLTYKHAFLFTTVEEVPDIADFENVLKTRRNHEMITDRIGEILKESVGDMLILSTESCEICKKCTYPDAPCRNPQKMHPCVESFGILVTRLAEDNGITFMDGGNVVTWFSLILYNE